MSLDCQEEEHSCYDFIELWGMWIMLVYWMRWRNKRPFERELSDMRTYEEEEGKEKELQKESRQRDSI